MSAGGKSGRGRKHKHISAERKADIKAILIVLCVLLLLTAGRTVLSPKRGMFYLGGSRIKGAVSIYLDGEPIDAGSVIVTDVSRTASKKRDLSFGRDGNTVSIADEAGEKTRYSYELDIPCCGRPVRVSVYHSVWHQVTRFTCELRLESTENGVRAEYTSRTKASNHSVFEGEKEYSRSFGEDEEIIISI